MNPLPGCLCMCLKKRARALCPGLEPESTRYDDQQNKQYEDYARRSKSAEPFYAAHVYIPLPFDLVYLMMVICPLIGWAGKCALAEKPKDRDSFDRLRNSLF